MALRSVAGADFVGSSTSAVLPVPPDAEVGDRAIVSVFVNQDKAIAPPDTSTWPELISPGFFSGRGRVRWWHHVVTADDITAGSWPFTWSGSAENFAMVSLSSGRDTSDTPFDFTNLQAQSVAQMPPFGGDVLTDGADVVIHSVDFQGSASITCVDGATPAAQYTLHGNPDVGNNANSSRIFSRDGVAAGSITAQTSSVAADTWWNMMAVIKPGSSGGTSAAVAPPAARATADATAPQIAVGNSTPADIAPPAAGAQATAAAPGVRASVDATPAAGRATATASPPAVRAGASIPAQVEPPAGTAAAGATPPRVETGTSIPAAVAAPSAAATAASTAPTIHAGISVPVPSSTASASMTAPEVTVGTVVQANVQPPAAAATASATAPTVTARSPIPFTVRPPVATAIAAAAAPRINTGGQRDITLTVGPPIVGWHVGATTTGWAAGQPIT